VLDIRYGRKNYYLKSIIQNPKLWPSKNLNRAEVLLLAKQSKEIGNAPIAEKK